MQKKEDRKNEGEEKLMLHVKSFIKIFFTISLLLFLGFYLFPEFVRNLADSVLENVDFFTRTTTIELITILAVLYLFLRKSEISSEIKKYPDFHGIVAEVIKERFFGFMIFASEVLLSVFVFFIASYFLAAMFGKLRFDLEDKTDLLTLLEVLLGFLGATGAGIYYFISKAIANDVEEKIRKKEDEIEKCFEIERELSKAEIHLNSGYNHMRFCEFYIENRKENGNGNNPYKTTENCADNPAYSEILKAISRARKGKKYLGKVKVLDENEEKVKYKRKYYIAHNNFAYYLERKWDYIFMFEGIKGLKSEIEKYFRENEDKGRDYGGDKRKVFENIDFLHEEKVIEKFHSLSDSFQDTENKISKTFLV